jgi:2-deoxy-D-gluconate 3-dehydrogenase
MSAFDLDGHCALVTGANTGIGQAIALGLAEAGATVIGAGRSSMVETAALVARTGHRFDSLEVDLAEPRQAQNLMARAAEAGLQPDILVNNAGVIRRAAALDVSEADWDAVLDTNLKSVFFLTQAFARTIVEAGRRAKVINIASLLSFQGGVRVAAYTASKSGLAGLTRLLANEWAAKGINVNAIAPGYIATNNTQALRDDTMRSSEILARIPARRWGAAPDIAGAAVFLASPAADYVHGVVLPVDGGWLAR